MVAVQNTLKDCRPKGTIVCMIKPKDANNFPFKAMVCAIVFYLTIIVRLWAQVFYEQKVNKALPSWLSFIENKGK